MSKGNKVLRPSVFIGEIFTNKHGDNFELVEYVKAIKVRVKSLTTGNDQIWTTAKHLKLGNIWDPMKPITCGVGYMGIGPYRSKHNRKADEAYNRWNNMMFRCYDPETQSKQMAYVGCSVKEVWHNFQNYAEWYYNNPFYKFGWNVDKDLLVFGNREYGPSTCVLLPPAINSALQMRSDKADGLPHGVKINSTCKHLFEASSSLFDKKTYIGLYPTVEQAYTAYKEFREKHVKALVLEYKDQIDPVVYEKLMNFKVEDYGR